MPSWYWSPPADARRNQPNGRSQRSSRGQGGDHDDFHASHPPKLTRFGPGLGAFMAGVTDGGGPRALRVTCARDGREHLVSDTEMDAGHAGPRVALCGHEVLPTVHGDGALVGAPDTEGTCAEGPAGGSHDAYRDGGGEAFCDEGDGR
ncbi:MAG: hypothetical protein LC799_35090 [Actinobacteria bacterium]|nr:hypothetical protein [Actinomycetota bacterium]